jgi:hypothetical protein
MQKVRGLNCIQLVLIINKAKPAGLVRGDHKSVAFGIYAAFPPIPFKAVFIIAVRFYN